MSKNIPMSGKQATGYETPSIKKLKDAQHGTDFFRPTIGMPIYIKYVHN